MNKQRNIQKQLAKTLRHKICFLENITDVETHQEEWSEKFWSFASINQINESSFNMLENLNFGNVISNALFLFKIRFIENVTTDMRILFKDRIFKLQKIINHKEQDRLLFIIALEITT
ncbi:MAG: head-tail adaptor protein [Rickettsiaceae bacterium]